MRKLIVKDASALEFLGMTIALSLVAIFTLGLTLPLVLFWQLRYIVNHTQIEA